MDALAHVNNVSYADYVREARLAMLSEGALDPARTQVAELAIDYRTPLVFRPEPVRVESWLEGETLVQEVLDRGETGERHTYVRTRTSLRAADAAPVTLAPTALPHTWPLAVRQSDLGPGGAVDEVAMLELFQESRISFIETLGAREDASHRVVGRSAATYFAPVLGGPHRYEVRTGVEDMTRSTFTLRAEVVDVAAGAVLAAARTTLVGFDRASARSRPLTERERGHLAQLAEAGGGGLTGHGTMER